MADTGSLVIGVEKRADVVAKTNKGIRNFPKAGSQLPCAGYSVGQTRAMQHFPEHPVCDTYIITVGTPCRAPASCGWNVESAARQVAANMPDGALVIVRSTVKVAPPGTSSPRSSPGKQFESLCARSGRSRARPCRSCANCRRSSAQTSPRWDRAAAVFRPLTNSVVQVSNLETAEIIKLVDNT